MPAAEPVPVALPESRYERPGTLTSQLADFRAERTSRDSRGHLVVDGSIPDGAERGRVEIVQAVSPITFQGSVMNRVMVKEVGRRGFGRDLTLGELRSLQQALQRWVANNPKDPSFAQQQGLLASVVEQIEDINPKALEPLELQLTSFVVGDVEMAGTRLTISGKTPDGSEIELRVEDWKATGEPIAMSRQNGREVAMPRPLEHNELVALVDGLDRWMYAHPPDPRTSAAAQMMRLAEATASG